MSRASILDPAHPAEGELRAAQRLGARHALSHVLLGFVFDMEAQLVVQLALEIGATDDRTQPVA